MAAEIKKLQVDVDANLLSILATTSGQTTEGGETFHHKYYKVAIDSTKTFNCKNEPSTSATTINVTVAQDTNLDKNISFDDIICSSDIENDILFIWLYEKKYVIRPILNTLAEDFDVFITDGTEYYKCHMGEDYKLEEMVMTKTEAPLHAEEFGTSLVYYAGKYIYFEHKDLYYRMNRTSLEVEELTIDKYPVYSDHDTTYNDDHYPDNVLFGVTLSVKSFYELLLNHIDIVSSDTCNCKVECSDVNFMLAWDGFNLAKTLQDYNQMIKYWNILHKSNTATYSSCGCNR